MSHKVIRSSCLQVETLRPEDLKTGDRPFTLAFMRPEIGTADIVVGVLAAVGVVILIVLFVWVFRDRMLKK
jgi:hypothetical protein